jgi:hypothetical protein
MHGRRVEKRSKKKRRKRENYKKKGLRCWSSTTWEMYVM